MLVLVVVEYMSLAAGMPHTPPQTLEQYISLLVNIPEMIWLNFWFGTNFRIVFSIPILFERLFTKPMLSLSPYRWFFHVIVLLTTTPRIFSLDYCDYFSIFLDDILEHSCFFMRGGWWIIICEHNYRGLFARSFWVIFRMLNYVRKFIYENEEQQRSQDGSLRNSPRDTEEGWKRGFYLNTLLTSIQILVEPGYCIFIKLILFELLDQKLVIYDIKSCSKIKENGGRELWI